MTELSRSLIAAARQGLAPDAAVAARVRAKVAAAVGVGAATGSVAAIPTAKAAGSSAALLKLGAALLVIGVVATALVLTRPAHTPEAPRIAVTPRNTDDLRSEDRVVASAPVTERALAVRPGTHESHALAPATPVEAAGGAEPSAVEPDQPAQEETESADAAAKRTKRGADEELAEGVSLSREVELIDLAMVSLRKRAPHAALEAIKAYDRETHGRGQMAEDAAAIEIEARCNMNLDATTQIERFDTKWPESAQRERIQTACFAKP
jgi:hypothetical protein